MNMHTPREIITSRKNPFLMKIASLHEKKYREEHKLFLIEGKKLVLEAIGAGIVPEDILICEEKYADMLSLVETACLEKGVSLPRVSCFAEGCFEKISTEKAPEGIIAVAKHLDFFKKSIKIDGRQQLDSFLPTDERSLVLYDIRDPGNLGAVLRSALAFGVERIVFGGSCVDLYNPKTVRAAMGALFRLKYAFLDDFSEYVAFLHRHNRRLLAAELTERAHPLQNIGVTPQDIFVIGNEGHGIPAEVSALCHDSVYIPISSESESLNASVAASILLWEQMRTVN